MKNNQQVTECIKENNKHLWRAATKYNMDIIMENYNKYKSYKYPENKDQEIENKIKSYWSTIFCIISFRMDEIREIRLRQLGL